MVKKRIFNPTKQNAKTEPKTNSGELVFNKILGKEKKQVNLIDFSNFPCDSEKINNISLGEIASCGFHNVARAYYSRTQLNGDFGYSDISLLSGKCITYAIVVDSGKWYFGSTEDFGERIGTWLKDFRGNEMSKKRKRVRENTANKELCEDIRKYGRALFICLGVYKTIREAKEKENELIVKFTLERFKEITNGEDPAHYSWRDITTHTKRFLYNKARAIGKV